MSVGGFFAFGALYYSIRPDPEMTVAWRAGMGLAGAFFLGLAALGCVRNFGERAAIARALQSGHAETRTGDIGVPPAHPMVGMLERLVPGVHRLIFGELQLVLPRSEWLEHLDLTAMPRRGVLAQRAFYLLSSGQLSVERQASLGLLKTRSEGFYLLAAALLIFLGVGFLGANDATPTIHLVGGVALALGVAAGEFGIRVIRLNRRFANALRESLRPQHSASA
jgi:hypothetical protein